MVRAARLRASSVLALLLCGMYVAWRAQLDLAYLGASFPVWLFAGCSLLGILAASIRSSSRTSGPHHTPARLARLVLLSLATVLFGSGWWMVRTTPAPGSLAESLRNGGESLVTVRGVVLDRPDVSNTTRGALAPFMRYTPAARFSLSVRKVLVDHGTSRSWHAASGTLRVRVAGVDGIDRSWIDTPTGRIRAGDTITLTGRASGTGVLGRDVLGNPGELDVAAWSAQEGVAGSLAIESPELVRPEPEASSASDLALGLVLRARASLQDAAIRALTPRSLPGVPVGTEEQAEARREARALLLSLVLGVNEFREDQVSQRFTRLGIVHALAISGYHVALLAGIVSLAVRLTGDHGRLEPIAVACSVLLYAAIVPASAPVLRAAVCVVALLGTRALGRRYDDVCVLLWAAIVLALWKPVEAFSLGFVLSFGLCGLLMTAGSRVHARLTGPRLRGLVPRRRSTLRSVWEWLSRGATAAILCSTTAAPVIAWWTGWLSPVALLSSVALVPALSVVLASGLVAMLIGVLAKFLAPGHAEAISVVLAAPLEWTSEQIVRLSHRLDSVPLGSLPVPPINGAWTLAATLLVLAWFVRGHARHVRLWIATAGLAAWLAAEALLVWPESGLSSRDECRADVFSVGDGLCVSLRVRTPEGVASLLVDAGCERSSLGLRTIPAALRAVGVWRVETALVLGTEAEHFSMLIDLARSIRLRRVLVHAAVFDEAAADPHGLHAALLRELTQLGVQVDRISAGDRLVFGEHSIELAAGRTSLRAVVRDAHGPRVAITHDAPAAFLAPTVIAASTAASKIGVAQLLREPGIGQLVLSTAEDPGAPERGVLRTAAAGIVSIGWRDGEPPCVRTGPAVIEKEFDAARGTKD